MLIVKEMVKGCITMIIYREILKFKVLDIFIMVIINFNGLIYVVSYNYVLVLC